MCPVADGGAIDASDFTDVDGTRYLLYKTDANAIGGVPGIYLQMVAADGVTLSGAPVRILQADRPEEQNIVEAPLLVREGGNHVLFYSQGAYNTDAYATSYAVATAVGGPYNKAYRALMTTDTFDRAVRGPGGAVIVRGTPDRIVFHGWLGTDFSARGMYVADLGWANGYPIVRGSRVRSEAERGRLNHCVVRTGVPGASEGAVVAYIDYPDSWVDIDVYVPTAGTYTVYAGYANGSSGVAEHEVSVNGVVAATMSYPVTGWDNWQQSSVGVTLQAGWNTLRFRHLTLYAELDYIEVA